MKVIIAGGRSYSFTKLDYRKLAAFAHQHDITEIVSGCARGVDTEGQLWANNRKILVKQFPANWDEYGSRAGFLRNIEMAKYADTLIAFTGATGTDHMVRTAKHYELQVFDWRIK